MVNLGEEVKVLFEELCLGIADCRVNRFVRGIISLERVHCRNQSQGWSGP